MQGIPINHKRARIRQALLLSLIYIYIYISDKSHSWLANSSPLEVSGMRIIINILFKTIRGSIISFWVLKPSPSESL